MITLFYRQIALMEGLPFPVRLPNASTRKALQEAKARYLLETYDSVEELLEDLDE